ncbi:hypothetical protein Aperf_G00000047746 [Anoplocephala perfoliata]
MNRGEGDFGSVLNSLRFSSSENDVGGLDEALQKFAEKKALASKRRRGPIEGIPDDDSVPAQFEYAEDAMISCATLSEEDSLVDANNNLSSSAPNDVSLHIQRPGLLEAEVSSSAPGIGVQQETSGHSVTLGSSGLPECGSIQCAGSFDANYRRHRPRTTSPSPTSHLSVYLKPVDILSQPLSISPSTSVKVLSSTTTQGALIIDDNKNNDAEVSLSTTASLPDFQEEDGSLRFKCSISSNKSYLFYCDSQLAVAPPPPPPPRRSPPQLPPRSPPPQLSETSAIPILLSESLSDAVPHSKSAEEEFIPPERPVRRRKKPSMTNRSIEEVSSPVVTEVTKELRPAAVSSSPFVLEPIQVNANHMPQRNIASEEEDPDILESQKTFFVFAIFSVAIFFLWYFSVSPFISGALLGGGVVFIIMRFWSFILKYLNSYSPDFHTDYCIFTRGGGVNSGCTSPTATCCTLHNTLLADWRPAYRGPLILPELRSLQAPPLPQLADEDPKTGPFGGPLGESLGYKLDSNNQPVYQAWMNETVSYSSETYHINDTHSVFVTLEGTQLRIQRPRKNVPRRAMFNVPVPSSSGMHFVHQRIYDMSRVTVSLLPEGLVAKRLWSKKYPICLTIQNEQEMRNILAMGNLFVNFQSNDFQDDAANLSSVKLRKQPLTSSQPDPRISRSSSDTTTSLAAVPISYAGTKAPLEEHSAYSVSTSRFLRVSTTPSVGIGATVATGYTEGIPPKLDDAKSLGATQSQDDFLLVQPSDLDDRIYLFTRTCREKETWFRRLYGASIGKPMLLTTQQAFKRLENSFVQRIKPTTSAPQMRTSASFSDITASAAAATKLAVGETEANVTVGAPTHHPITASVNESYDPELQVDYLRYMAKFMPAAWVLRASQALKLNLNYIKPDIHLPWLNALIARLAWDFLRHERWRERVQEKIQAKIRKKKFISLLNEPIVTNVDMGSELPVIRNVGKPFLDNQGLWLELEVVYTGGFTVSVETTVNVKKLEKASRQEGASGQSGSPTFNNSGGGSGTPPPTLFEPSGRNLAAFVSDEEDSADSSTDSDRENTLTKAFTSILPASNAPITAASGPFGTNPNAFTKLADPGFQTADEPAVEHSSVAAPKGRFHRIFDKITRSIYFQVADSRLVQYSLDFVTQMTLHLQLEVSMLHGTLVVNFPPPPSNRLWYGFRGNPNLRIKVKPKVGEYLFNFPRILEVIEKRMITEFQRVFVLPNMDDLVLPMLIPEDTSKQPKTSQKPDDSRNDDAPIPPQHLVQKRKESSEQVDVSEEKRSDTNITT